MHVFMFYPTSFFSNEIQIDQFEKKAVEQYLNTYMNIHPPINVLVTALIAVTYILTIKVQRL